MRFEGSWGTRRVLQTTCWRYLHLCLLAQELARSASAAVASQLMDGNHRHLIEIASGNLTGNDKQQDEPPQELPLYMRILATMACLIIFSIGICGNLLVPLVVIKTKYLRNSTNLFLINLSVADLLVLSVCMPTVLIELHSRPETWLLGEPMCKLSNYVEMLATNGSIFTILAISFERYYAICKPLKAGYKCTRLRATIIICIIWLLSSLLTAPILIMAKSSQTTFVDGSLVYNCILETSTYWQKMYVFISLIAFFCLPLLVLMLVYWLIGRRLIRENIAMSRATNTGVIEPACTSSKNKSARSHFSSILSVFNPKASNSLDNVLSDESDKKVLGDSKLDASSTIKRCMLSSNKTLSLDNHLMTRKRQQGSVRVRPRTFSQRSQLGSRHCFMSRPNNVRVTSKLNHSNVADKRRNNHRQPLAKQFFYRLFHLGHLDDKSLGDEDVELTNNKTDSSLSTHSSNKTILDERRDINNSVVSQTTGSDSSNDEHSSQTPFLSTFNLIAKTRGTAGNANEMLKKIESSSAFNGLSGSSCLSKKGCKSSGSKFRGWAKLGFSISSLSASTQTNCTTLPSESSSSATAAVAAEPPAKVTSSLNDEKDSSHSTTTSNNYMELPQEETTTNARSSLNQTRQTKKSAHFQIDGAALIDDSGLRPASCSSLSGSYTTSPCTSKSPSPDSMLARARQIHQTLTTSGSSAEGHIGKLQSKSNQRINIFPSKDERGFERQEFGSEIEYINSQSNIEKLTANQSNACDHFNYLKNLRQQTNINPLADMEVNQEGVVKCSYRDELAQRERRDTTKCREKQQGEIGNCRQTKKDPNFDIKLEKRLSQPLVCTYFQSGTQLSELMVIHDLSKKQQMDSRRQVVVMLAFVVACFFLLFFPYRVFTIWLILATEDQVQSLGMETYYNLTYFSRILIYLHSAINPIAYNLISTKFRRAFMSILLRRGSNSRRHFTTDHRATLATAAKSNSRGVKGNDQRKLNDSDK